MLVIVMVTILFAVTALVAFVEKAGDDLMVEARESVARRLRQEAYSALEVTLAVLEDFRQVNSGLRSPAEGWADPLAFAGWAPRDGCVAEVAFEDESGKLSLPNVTPAALMNLFDSWGMAQLDAEQLTDALLTWMRPDHVPATTRNADYDRSATPYEPPQRSLRSFSELAAIDTAREVFYDEHGAPNDLWRRFASAMSLFDYKQTNLNGGRSDVYAAMGVQDIGQQQQLDDYLHGTGGRERQGPGYFQSPEEAARLIGAGTLPDAFGTQISALRITITVREGRTAFRTSVVIAPPNGAKAVEPNLTRANARTKTEQATATTTPNQTGAAAGNGMSAAKKLNYPFTLLEIRENTEISAVPPVATKA